MARPWRLLECRSWWAVVWMSCEKHVQCLKNAEWIREIWEIWHICNSSCHANETKARTLKLGANSNRVMQFSPSILSQWAIPWFLGPSTSSRKPCRGTPLPSLKVEALSVSGALVALDTIPFKKKKTSQLQIAWCKRIFVWDYIFTVVLISKVLNHEFWGAHPATGIKPAQDWKLKDFSFQMLPEFSMFNSNTKGIVFFSVPSFIIVVSFDQHQWNPPPCPPGASSSSSMPLPLARSLGSSDVQGYTNHQDAILRATPFAFYERPAGAVPESSWIDKQKMYHQKYQNPY